MLVQPENTNDELLACGLAALVNIASILGQTPSCVDPPQSVVATVGDKVTL